MKKILISRTDGIGDLLLATPLIKEIKAEFNAYIGVLVSEYAGPVLLNNPDVDGIFVYGRGGKGMNAVKNAEFDEAVVLFPEFGASRFIKRCKIPKRTGTAYRWYSLFFFNNRVKMHRKKNEMHEADYNLALVKGFMGEKKAKRVFFYLFKEEEQKGRAYLKKKGIKRGFIMFYPGGRGTSSNLSAGAYAGIINSAAENFDNDVLVGGGPGDEKQLDMVMRGVKKNSRIFSVDSGLSLRMLASIINEAGVFISGSTGPMHIAAALGVKIMAFFPEGGVSPKRWGPIGTKTEIIETKKKYDAAAEQPGIIKKLHGLITVKGTGK